MSKNGLPENLLLRVSPVDAREYARSQGWKRVANAGGALAVFIHPTSELDQLLIPLDSGISDYDQLMADVVYNLAEAESRPVSEILNDLLLPPSDVLRFRLDEPGTETGDIPLEKGIELLLGVQKALKAAACSVGHPQRFHPRLSRSEAERLSEQCRLGQTERGSFTAVVACPIKNELEDTLPLFPEIREDWDFRSPTSSQPTPFVRQATSLLVETIHEIAAAIDEDRVDPLENSETSSPGLSANLCEALVMMHPSGDRARLTIRATWSRTLPPSEKLQSHSFIQLRKEHFRVIEELSVRLRPIEQSKSTRIIALVDALFGDPDTEKRVSGEVQLLVFAEEGTFKARVHLNPDDYATAAGAHLSASYVSLSGVLKRGTRSHRIEEVKNLLDLSRVE